MKRPAALNVCGDHSKHVSPKSNQNVEKNSGEILIYILK